MYKGIKVCHEVLDIVIEEKEEEDCFWDLFVTVSCLVKVFILSFAYAFFALSVYTRYLYTANSWIKTNHGRLQRYDNLFAHHLISLPTVNISTRRYYSLQFFYLKERMEDEFRAMYGQYYIKKQVA